MSVGNRDLPVGVEKGNVPFDGKSLPPRGNEELGNLFLSGRRAGDGRLPNQKSKSGLGLIRPQETNFISEKFVVKQPALEVIDRRRPVFLAGPVHHQKSEKIGPSGLQDGGLAGQEPNLMFVTLVVRLATQLFGRSFEEESSLTSVLEEDSDLFV